MATGFPCADRLTRPKAVVEIDPVCVSLVCMGGPLEGLAMHALLLRRMDQALHDAVLLWTPWVDVFLALTIAVSVLCVIPVGHGEPVVAAQK